ncbi:hypothetical protein C5167_003820 [Papaver somniferum]|uniref:Neprosin PEP catalytic domain-containing protein n=1 Tax=Papaver somniferum TaxID=3469 RepID=A0A4Y7L578_PAPSO|nr:uncharacterized protein LOC113309007 isoform X1 [Papaver somniferum]RZC79578.1 hypothetical protein C5167_003820 [Papaver somniferum]
MPKFTDFKCWILILIISVNEGLIEGRMNMKAVNKAIIKIIKVGHVETIDCYDIYRQPSLNHPLLCNHTIQMRPTLNPKGTKADISGTLELTQTWHKCGSCPEGTIPIRRKGKNYNPTILRKHHYARLSPFKTLVTSKSNNTIDNYNLHEYAVIGVLGNFLGAQAKINIWTPFTEAHEMSISQIWVFSGEDKDLNTVEAGWHVYKDMYGDDQTRFFIYWTMDGYRSGCYNLLCDGFVQTTSNISLGCNFTEVSTFNGDQKDATFSIQKDQSSGNWWVKLQGISVGYYPSALFKELSRTATKVEWGGEIVNLKNKGQHTSTQMGSSHFPSEGGLKTSSYFNWVQVFDENNMIKDPENVRKIATNPNCYNLKIDK